MSTLIVKSVKIDAYFPHDNADTLSILQIGGWTVVAKTNGIMGQENVVYIPIDAIADKDHPLLGFLEGKRVKTIKLRGVISQGLCLPIPEVRQYLKSLGGSLAIDENIEYLLDPKNEVNLAEVLNIRKYEPPPPSEGREFLGGDSEAANKDFHKYTDIEHYANYVSAIQDEKVWVSEKLHGTSARFAICDGKFLIGSRNRQFKYPVEEGRKVSTYIAVFEREGINQKLLQLQNEFPQSKIVAVYGEIAGPGIQGSKFRYGCKEPTFFLYDIQVDGRYLDHSNFIRLSTKHEFKTVPIFAENIDVKDAFDFVDGKTTLDEHIREGIVIKPMKEKFDRKLGRVVLKIVSKQYLLKDVEDYKNE